MAIDFRRALQGLLFMAAAIPVAAAAFETEAPTSAVRPGVYQRVTKSPLFPSGGRETGTLRITRASPARANFQLEATWNPVKSDDGVLTRVGVIEDGFMRITGLKARYEPGGDAEQCVIDFKFTRATVDVTQRKKCGWFGEGVDATGRYNLVSERAQPLTVADIVGKYESPATRCSQMVGELVPCDRKIRDALVIEALDQARVRLSVESTQTNLHGCSVEAEVTLANNRLLYCPTEPDYEGACLLVSVTPKQFNLALIGGASRDPFCGRRATVDGLRFPRKALPTRSGRASSSPRSERF